MSAPFDTLKVGIDGLNISLTRGTGLATYARGLGATLHAAGADVEFVFDAPSSRSGDPLLREAALTDAQPFVETRRRRAARIGIAAMRGVAGIKAAPLPDIAATLRAAAAEPLPADARLSVAPDLVDAASFLFRRFGRFAQVSPVSAPAIFHWTHPVPIKAAGAKNIYTIHDLAPLRLPHATLDNKSFFLRLLMKILTQADAILTVSEFAKREISGMLGAAESRIAVVPPVVEIGPPGDPAADRRFIESAYGLTWGGYFLYFGAAEPKKNLGRLLEAFAGASGETPLVMVSSLAWLSDAELRLLAPYLDTSDAPLRRRVRMIDYLPRQDLRRLIRGAKAVLFPSVYEGFGLPAAEALALGAAVIASRGTALEETTAGAALLVDPFDPADIRAGLDAVADPERRRSLAALGPERMRRYSREAQTHALSEVYGKLLNP